MTDPSIAATSPSEAINHSETGWAREVASGNRFRFGHNWSLFLDRLTDRRIALAEDSMRKMLEVETLSGRTFLDIGCGSGLFSLVARRLGAKVFSFDFDPDSVGCAEELRRRYFAGDADWRIEQGSVLDEAYIDSLGKFDVVYSWGVLHHTGDMSQALKNAGRAVDLGGTLYIAIYNDQGAPSRTWTAVKKAYVSLPSSLRWLITIPATVRLWGPVMVRDLLRGKPFETWRNYPDSNSRGMDAWRDVVDWVGGYPFEVAKPEEIFDFYRVRGYQLRKLITCAGGLGCNEFVLERT